MGLRGRWTARSCPEARNIPRVRGFATCTDNPREGPMASADVESLVKDIFAEDIGDLHRRPYKPEDREAEAAKIARLRQLRFAKSGEAPPFPKRKRGLIVTR